MLYESENGDFTIVLTGDAMLTRRLSPFREERYLELLKILQNADATFTNLETTVGNRDEGTPSISHGTVMSTDPRLIHDLKGIGINIVSCANNHVFNYGEGGILATMRHLDETGLTYAGIGRNLAEARAPAYFDTHHGRLALIAATTFFKTWEKAGDQRRDMKGRPGVNALGFQTAYAVDQRAFAQLARIRDQLGFNLLEERNRRHFFSAQEIPFSNQTDLSFLGHRFALGANFSFSTHVNSRDREENLRSIREARRQADWVLFSLHNHELGGESLLKAQSHSGISHTADFIAAFAREAIDAGADLVVGHGPHFPLGIEIYKGKPIFYSLGNFIFQNETVKVLPAESYERFGLDSSATLADFLDTRTDQDRKGHPVDPLYWENFVAVCHFKEKKLDEILLYPIDLGHGRRRSQRGRPVLAETPVAARIIDRVRRLSQRYGTRIEEMGNKGVVSRVS
ncbi:MAG: CapA family protein [Deltaproteobacteria bacterium]|nr:CapA family protein [Deltaproteobacteria bacterium]